MIVPILGDCQLAELHVEEGEYCKIFGETSDSLSFALFLPVMSLGIHLIA